MVIRAYFDASGNSTMPWLTLVGAAGDDSVWARVENEWGTVLANRAPPARYLHLVEAVALKEEFARRKGWDEEKVGALLFDCLQYVQTLDKSAFRYFFCSVDIAAHARLRAEGCQIRDPEDLCSEWCPGMVPKWYASEYPHVLGPFEYFFDQGEPFRDRFENRLRGDKWGSGWFLWKMISSVCEADMRDTPGIQIADLLAWATNRERVGQSKTYLHLSEIVKMITPSSGIVWDEKRLRQSLDGF